MKLNKNKPDKNYYDVIVLGVWFGANYGSILNGYSIFRLLKNLGKSVLMVQKINAKPDDREINNSLSSRFIDKYYPDEAISPLYSSEELVALNEYTDTFLVGSDQIFDYYICSYFKDAFLLGFVSNEKRKISFGTSFGHERDKTPQEKWDYRRRLFKRFNAISVREFSGVSIMRDNYRIKADKVLEPVFCVDKDVYMELVEESNYVQENPYILTYILDPSPEKIKIIKDYAEETGKEVINILDGQPHTFSQNIKMMDMPNCLTNINVEDFLCLYYHADFVISDSFHGTSFAIIFNKPFLAIANSRRGYTRFEDLLGSFDLKDHMVYDNTLNSFKWNKTYTENFNYDDVNKKIEILRIEAIRWLTSALRVDVNRTVGYKDIVSTIDMSMCSGCGTCVSICPQKALSFSKDEWGYYIPSINIEKCNDCGICTEKCPANNLPRNGNTDMPECYEYIANNDDILYCSSSGGAFASLAKKILKEKGVVFGAAWTKDLFVEHIMIESEDELWQLHKSKYIQSYIGNSYITVKEKLNQGLRVLFTGTPCQCAGLRAYLGNKDYSKLIIVDIFCSNAPSGDFFKKYLEDSFDEKITKYEFRYKKPEWNWDCITIKATDMLNGELVLQGGAQDSFQRVFHNHTMCSKHCEECKYQTLPRYGDITIGDFWGIGKRDPSCDTSKGVSVVLCNNDKGKLFFEESTEGMFTVRKQVPLEWIGGNGYAIQGSHSYAPKSRDLFYKAILKMPFGEAVNYALKPNHGQFRDIYKKTNALLQYDANMLHFHFERDVWEELCIEGRTTLIVKNGKWQQRGHYARLSLAGMLSKSKKYRLYSKIKIKSTATVLNFHIIDSGSRQLQIIHSESIKGKNNGDQWIEVNDTFIPNTDLYDEFMFGAAQISGNNNYLMIASINIVNIEEA